MKSNIFIFHGTEGYPEENWFPWLKKELEERGHKVFVPQFPTPENENLDAWLEVLKPYREYINEESILIGHSLGSLFLLRILERLERPIKIAVFVAGITGIKPINNYDASNFSNGFNFNWAKIKSNVKNFIVYHSDNDPYLVVDHGNDIAHNLGVSLILVPNAGHFNTKAGYIKFEALLEKLENILSK